MIRLEELQKITSNVIAVVDSLSTDIYYFQVNSPTYSPATGAFAYAGEISITGNDIAVDGTNLYLTSISTDLSTFPVDGTYMRISGFTNSENNGFKKATVAAENSVTLSGTGLVTEAAGNDITLYGPYYYFKGIKRQFSAEEIDGINILLKDELLRFAGYDLSITPKNVDILFTDEDDTITQWNIISVKSDLAKAVYSLQLRRP